MTDAEFVARFPTPEAYLAHHQASGHLCCGCVNLQPALACCNPGHDVAERLRIEFEQITNGGRS